MKFKNRWDYKVGKGSCFIASLINIHLCFKQASKYIYRRVEVIGVAVRHQCERLTICEFLLF